MNKKLLLSALFFVAINLQAKELKQDSLNCNNNLTSVTSKLELLKSNVNSYKNLTASTIWIPAEFSIEVNLKNRAFIEALEENQKARESSLLRNDNDFCLKIGVNDIAEINTINVYLEKSVLAIEQISESNNCLVNKLDCYKKFLKEEQSISKSLIKN